MGLWNEQRKWRRRLWGGVCLAAVLLYGAGWIGRSVRAQVPLEGPQPVTEADSAGGNGPSATGDSVSPVAGDSGSGVDLWRLLISGGPFMIPIVIMSLISATFIIERALALRRHRVLPPGLVRGLGELVDSDEPFDPRQAYQLCQQYPSAAANVVRALLLRVGRPHSEIEHTVAEVSQREAERLHANVRWLVLAAAVTPLMGLLGTVWGLIQAFYDTTQLAPGMNKAEQLARGIYIALVTTLSGLIVAIPSAIAAHLFEGRLQNLFHRIDELVFNLMPHVERYEGRVRFRQAEEELDRQPPARRAQGASP